jgi:hypothetical protein
MVSSRGHAEVVESLWAQKQLDPKPYVAVSPIAWSQPKVRSREGFSEEGITSTLQVFAVRRKGRSRVLLDLH